jgi:hypothetical protein
MAVALPIPRDPPVTRHVFSESGVLIWLLLRITSPALNRLSTTITGTKNAPVYTRAFRLLILFVASIQEGGLRQCSTAHHHWIEEASLPHEYPWESDVERKLSAVPRPPIMGISISRGIQQCKGSRKRFCAAQRLGNELRLLWKIPRPEARLPYSEMPTTPANAIPHRPITAH